MSRLTLSGKKILLLLLYSPGENSNINEPVAGRTRLIKMMFLFDKEIKKDFAKDRDLEFIKMPEFFPWHYGPFSKDVFDYLEFFINNGYISSTPLDTERSESEESEYRNWMDDYLFDDERDLLSNIRNEEHFSLTGVGIDFVKQRLDWEELSENQKMILREFKKGINAASLQAILRYTYLKYPDYTGKSKIKDGVLE